MNCNNSIALIAINITDIALNIIVLYAPNGVKPIISPNIAPVPAILLVTNSPPSIKLLSLAILLLDNV